MAKIISLTGLGCKVLDCISMEIIRSLIDYINILVQYSSGDIEEISCQSQESPSFMDVRMSILLDLKVYF